MKSFTLTAERAAILKAIHILQGGQSILFPAHLIRRVVETQLDTKCCILNQDLISLAKMKLLRTSKRGFYTLTRQGRHIASHL